MKENEAVFSETEDSKLKQFLTGGRVYGMLAAAIITGVVFVITLAAIIGIYSNCKEAENLKDLTGLDVSGDLDGQYIKGNAYKFLAKLGYIAETEAAATHYYYFMYTDAADGQQYVTLVEIPKEMDETVQKVIDAFLAYAQNPEGGYSGGAFSDMTGRFKSMTSDESKLMATGISSLGLQQERTIGYTLKIGPLPKKTDTVGYWFIAIPFGAAAVVCAVLFIYGLRLEDMRAESQKSPYPYQNRKK